MKGGEGELDPRTTRFTHRPLTGITASCGMFVAPQADKHATLSWVSGRNEPEDRRPGGLCRRRSKISLPRGSGAPQARRTQPAELPEFRRKHAEILSFAPDQQPPVCRLHKRPHPG